MDPKFCTLKGNCKDTKQKKLTELQVFMKYESNKLGLNKDTPFLSTHNTFEHKG